MLTEGILKMKFRKTSALLFAISMVVATGAVRPTPVSAQLEELLEPLLEGVGEIGGAVSEAAAAAAPHVLEFGKDVARGYAVKKTVDFVDRQLSGTQTQNGYSGWSTSPTQGSWSWSYAPPSQGYRGWETGAQPSRPYWEYGYARSSFDQGRQPSGRSRVPQRAGWGRESSARPVTYEHDADMKGLKADNEQLLVPTGGRENAKYRRRKPANYL